MQRVFAYLLILCVITVTFLCCLGWPTSAQQEESWSTWPSDFLTVQVHNYETRLSYDQTRIHHQARERIQGWQVVRAGQEYGFLSMHQYQLATGGHYYFLRYMPALVTAEDLELSLPITLTDYEYRTILYPQGLDMAKSVWSRPISGKLGDDLPTSALYVDDLLGSYFFSYVDVFKRQKNQVKQELYSLARPIRFTETGLELTFPHLPGGMVEQWGILSLEPLVDWTNQTAVEDVRLADLNRVRKWSQEGVFYQTPTSYYPTSPTSFYLNPAHHIGEKFLRSTGGKLFDHVALLSLYTASRMQNERGYWYTTPRSEWLYREYGIPNTFYDTRFSTDAALFLLKGYRRFKEPLFLEAAERYGDFFSQFAHSHHFKTARGGFLVWDYGHDLFPHTPTHVSLNHLVTEMNFLYELYKETEQPEYLELAHKIKLAVQDTAPFWKKETNGDLWYAYLVDGRYGLEDYPLLTLKDLRYSQQLIKEVDGEEDPAFGYLIQVKETYLHKNHLPLY